LAAWEGNQNGLDEMLQPVLRPLAAYLADAEKRNPHAYIYPFELAQVLGMCGDYFGDRAAYDKALEALDRAIKISPKRQSIYLIKGKIYLGLGEAEKAAAVLKEAIDVYPAARDPHWFYGLTLVNLGNLSEGIKEMELGKGAGELKLSEAQYLISLYAANGEYAKIVPIYEHLVSAYPERAAEWWARLAATYLMMRDKDNASRAALQALALDPSLKAGMKNFLEQLEKLP